MQTQTEAFWNPAAGVIPRSPWSVVGVRVMPGYRLWVRFLDGVEGIVEMEGLIFSEQAGVFSILRDDALFASAFIDHGAVSWPGELDLAPDAMHDEIEGHGVWVLS
ncbi:MAG: DUF2442 domain-containing protein [Magnetococcales bacterium]|nr:DUF2442 domain-containing protein [Magnetococcales bacterium]